METNRFSQFSVIVDVWPSKSTMGRSMPPDHNIIGSAITAPGPESAPSQMVTGSPNCTSLMASASSVESNPLSVMEIPRASTVEPSSMVCPIPINALIPIHVWLFHEMEPNPDHRYTVPDENCA